MTRVEIVNHQYALQMDNQYLEQWLTNRVHVLGLAVKPAHIARLQSDLKNTRKRIDEQRRLINSLEKQLSIAKG